MLRNRRKLHLNLPYGEAAIRSGLCAGTGPPLSRGRPVVLPPAPGTERHVDGSVEF